MTESVISEIRRALFDWKLLHPNRHPQRVKLPWDVRRRIEEWTAERNLVRELFTFWGMEVVGYDGFDIMFE